ncbi:hypothetical protein [Aurantimonas marianensis]|uniref:Uncharacterized protein n=1 Tax=Aurantimonas marianensis TaxID=2920428 RepID=A0A9X2KJE5_9HYPH|nr:hypothetical protein [Aurantimonas marianensis]MCP3056592.1 hypothetical protein [Aurantimonas marianensis]
MLPLRHIIAITQPFDRISDGRGISGQGERAMVKPLKIKPGVDEIFGTGNADKFLLSASSKNSEIVTINNFELGIDQLQYGKMNAVGYSFEWVDDGGDSQQNDLLITMGNQKVLLSNVGDQVPDPVEFDFFQGFEDDTSGVIDGGGGWFGNVTQTNTGANGIDAASGDFYGIVEQTGGSSPTGPFTRYGDRDADPFDGEYTTSIKVYLDSAADGGGGWDDGEGFDFSVAANKTDDTHLRDFIFHVTQDTSTGDLLINASNNTNFDPREDLDTLAGTATITEDGWYTFEHRFYDNGGVLAVDLNVIDEDGTIIFTKTLSDAGDDINNVGTDPRYGWFTNIDVDGGIAVDDWSLQHEQNQIQNLPLVDDIFGMG